MNKPTRTFKFQSRLLPKLTENRKKCYFYALQWSYIKLKDQVYSASAFGYLKIQHQEYENSFMFFTEVIWAGMFSAPLAVLAKCIALRNGMMVFSLHYLTAIMQMVWEQ